MCWVKTLTCFGNILYHWANFRCCNWPNINKQSSHLFTMLVSMANNETVSLQVEVFRGIPFAAPPVGNLRFMPPVTVTPWRETRSAATFGPVCPQLMPDTRNDTLALQSMGRGRLRALRNLKPILANQSEDCLYLNDYAPVSGKTSLTNLIPCYDVHVTVKGKTKFYIR